MESFPAVESSLVELLDRVLDRGLVLNADIIISLAGVPLIGIKLRAALAGMETMARYGMLTDWDEAIRAQGAATGSTPPALAAFQNHLARRERAELALNEAEW